MEPILPDTTPHPSHDIILVDELDRATGSGRKLSVHERGLLHRAFSVFLVDREGSWLLQQRAATKYHCPLLWANACCGHPRPGEAVDVGAARRLVEELGVSVPFRPVGALVYRAALEGGLVEYEYDHLFAGVLDGPCVPAPDEVAAVRWTTLPGLRAEVDASPDRFTPWLRAILRGEATGAGVDRLIAGGGILDPGV